MSTTTPTYLLPMQRDVALFHDAFGMPNLIATPGRLPFDRIDLRIGLIREEGVSELREAVAKGDVILAIDALIDTVYVALGALVEMGQDAGVPLTEDDVIRPELEVGILLRGASVTVIRNRTYLGMLEAAFNRSNVVRAVEILQAIIRNALTTLTKAGVDPQPFFDEIQRANMSKLGADGKPIHSRGIELDGFPEGKVLKGPNYRAPDLLSVYHRLFEQQPLSEFERGARAVAEAMRFYFLDENEQPIFDVSSDELKSFEEGAVADVLRGEQLRLAVEDPAETAIAA